MCLSTDIEIYVRTIAGVDASLSEIWLIGSRANGTVTKNSDWDFLVFGGAPLHKSLAALGDLRRPDVDLLVLEPDGDTFSTPWPAEESKRGSLSDWRWQASGDQATYEQAVFVRNDEDSENFGSEMGDIFRETKLAIRVWPHQA